MSTTIVDLDQAVLEAAAHLYVWALKDIPQDLRDALAAARDRETSVTGLRVLETIVRNVEIADEQDNLVCQDTGIAVYYCRVGEHFPLHPARIQAALKAGIPVAERFGARSSRSEFPGGLPHGMDPETVHAAWTPRRGPRDRD